MTVFRSDEAISPVPIKTAAGFTLIEIMVVLLILSIVTLFVMLAVGRQDPNQAITSQGQRLRALMQLARTRAMLQPAVIGLALSQQGYRFLAYHASPDGNPKQGAWLAYQGNDPLSTVRFSDPVQVSLAVAEKTLLVPLTLRRALPAIVFSMSGTVSPFTLRLQARKGKASYVLKSNGAGQLFSPSQ